MPEVDAQGKRIVEELSLGCQAVGGGQLRGDHGIDSVKATHCASPANNTSLGMSLPIKIFLLSRFSLGFQAAPTAEPINICTPYRPLRPIADTIGAPRLRSGQQPARAGIEPQIFWQNASPTDSVGRSLGTWPMLRWIAQIPDNLRLDHLNEAPVCPCGRST
jgi:hypothetical protein